MRKTEAIYTKKTNSGAVSVLGTVAYTPSEPGEIPDPTESAYNLEFQLNGKQFATVSLQQVTKDKKQGFSDEPHSMNNVILYCDSTDEDLGEIAFQLFENAVDRPNMPADTFLVLSDIQFAKAATDVVAACVKGIFEVQHQLDEKHPARYITYLHEEKTDEFDLLKAAGVPYFYCIEPLSADEDYVLACFDCNAYISELIASRMKAIKETPNPSEDFED